VGAVPYPYPYVAQPEEVAGLVELPVAALLAPGRHRVGSREASGMLHEVHAFDVGGRSCSGASARASSTSSLDRLEDGMRIYPVVMAGGAAPLLAAQPRKDRRSSSWRSTATSPCSPPPSDRLPAARPHPGHLRGLPAGTTPQRRGGSLPGLPRANLLVEPCPRNTAPAWGWRRSTCSGAIRTASWRMLPADHHVARPEALREALAAAAQARRRGRAWPPSASGPTGPRPATATSRSGARLQRLPARQEGLPPRTGGALRREAGPGHRLAATWPRRLPLELGHLPSSGRTSILDEIRRAMPVLGEQLAVIGRALGTRAYARTLERVFPAAPSISIDYGVMEKSQRIAVVPADFGWSDVGSFAALSEVRRARRPGQRAAGRRARGRRRATTSSWRTGRRPVAVVALDGVVVVDAGDAVLVVRKERAQDVRKAVEELKRRGPRGAALGPVRPEAKGHGDHRQDDLPRVRHPRRGGPGPHRGARSQPGGAGAGRRSGSAGRGGWWSGATAGRAGRASPAP
jgi:mannose-1-phosphate guanylyltransferase